MKGLGVHENIGAYKFYFRKYFNPFFLCNSAKTTKGISIPLSTSKLTIRVIFCWPETFLSTLQNMGVKSLQGVENFQQGEVLFVQAAYNFLHAAKVHFMQL